MSVPRVNLEIKEQGRIRLLPPYNYTLRRIVSEHNVTVGTVHKSRQELKDEGLLLENEIKSNDTYYR